MACFVMCGRPEPVIFARRRSAAGVAPHLVCDVCHGLLPAQSQGDTLANDLYGELSERGERGAASTLRKRERAVITCPRCGLAVYPDTPACPRCNTPLAATAYRGPAGAPGPNGYQQGDTMGDNMPTWMRAVQGQALNQQRQGPPSGALGSAGIPPAAPREGVSLSEMISEENLPEWLRGAADAPGGAPGGATSHAAYPPYQPGRQGQPGQPPQWNAPRSPAYPASGFGPSGYPGHAPDPRATGNMATASAQPLYPQSGAPSVSAGQFVDESALPDWLRQVGGADAPRQPAQNAPYPPDQGYAQPGYGQGYPPSAQPAPQPPSAGQAPQPSAAFPSLDQASYGPTSAGRPAGAPYGGDQGGMAAQSLLDPQALPSWLGGPNGAAPQFGAARGDEAASGRAASMGMQAGSLVDENALPQWLRNEPATASPSQRVPAVAPGSVSQWITGAADEPLPSWLNQVYADVPAASQPSRSPQTPYMPTPGYAQYGPGGAPQASPYGSTDVAGAAAGGVAAGQFVDESALPDWLKAQGATPQPPYPATPQSSYLTPQQPGYLAPQSPAQAPYQPVTPEAPRGAAPASAMFTPQASQQFPQAEPGPSFSASDLIDPDALPSWVAGGQGRGTSKQRAVPPQQPIGAGRISGAAGWDDEGEMRGGGDQPGASVSRRPAATLGQATSRQPRPAAPQGANGQPGRNGQLAASSGALDGGWDDTPAAASAPYTQRQPAPQGRAGRLRPDDDAGAWNGAGQTGRDGRPLPPVQRGQPTGGLGQGAPLQREELPAWLRAGSAHAQPNGVAQGGAPSAQREPTYDEWDLPGEWDAGDPNGGQVGYAGYPEGYAEPDYNGAFDAGYAEARYGAGGAAGQRQAPGARGARGAQGQPDQQEKRGWRRIFGRR